MAANIISYHKLKDTHTVHYQFGAQVTDDAIVEELENLMKKEVFECLASTHTSKSAIPSPMIMTPKSYQTGK
jgi:hypothetical protein